MLKELSAVDNVLFRQCVTDAKTAVALARCLRTVIRAYRELNDPQTDQSIGANGYAEASFLHRLLASIMGSLRSNANDRLLAQEPRKLHKL